VPRGPDQPPPKRPRRGGAEILTDAESTLETAEYGLRDLMGADGRRKLPGLRNLIVFGRAVTNVLQNLRSVEPRFDDWYGVKEAEMRDDELLRFFYKLRSIVLKDGNLGGPIGSSVRVDYFDGIDRARLMANPPPGAMGFFIGDDLGGSGWAVAAPEGDVEKYYVALPGDLAVTTALHFDDPPTAHQSKALADTSVEALAQHYLDYLRGLVEEARATFGK
jgi:hypothetical protein